jgi:hypothetical protein
VEVWILHKKLIFNYRANVTPFFKPQKVFFMKKCTKSFKKICTFGVLLEREWHWLGRFFADFLSFRQDFRVFLIFFWKNILIKSKKIRANPLNLRHPRSNGIDFFQSGNCWWAVSCEWCPYFNIFLIKQFF